MKLKSVRGDRVKLGDRLKLWINKGEPVLVTRLVPYDGPLKFLGVGTQIASFGETSTGMTLEASCYYDVVVGD